MRRNLFGIASAVWLVLCAATAGLWVRSFWAADGRWLASPVADKSMEIRFFCSARGTLCYRVWRIDEREIPADPSAPAGTSVTSHYITIHYSSTSKRGTASMWFAGRNPAELLGPIGGSGAAVPEPGKRQIDVSALGFLFRRLDTLDPYTPAPYPQSVLHYTDRVVGIPHWLVAALAAIMPIAWLRRVRIRRRLTKGLCIRCGFDLRATPDRCPECGTPVQKNAESVA